MIQYGVIVRNALLVVLILLAYANYLLLNKDVNCDNTTQPDKDLLTTSISHGQKINNLNINLVEGNTTQPDKDLLTTSMSHGQKINNLNINLVEGKFYRNHPVLEAIPLQSYSIDQHYIIEINGLKVPSEYDCDNFNNGKPWNPAHQYFYAVPSRWYNCYMQEATLKSGIFISIPQIPLIDEEYAEMITVFQSTMRALPQRGFVMAEIGARWGTWGSRAIMNLQSNNNMSYELYFIEADPSNCEGLRQVMSANNLKYKLDCEYSSDIKFMNWASSVTHIDLIDVDIQGAETTFIPSIKKVLDEKAYRVIVGTHSAEIHQQMKDLFADWLPIYDIPMASNSCIEKISIYLRGSYGQNLAERFNWKSLLKTGCGIKSTFGVIFQWDGEIAFDNPRFVDKTKRFSLEDTELNIHDLIIS